jgi:D-3-phosphoglycerate dehydrogenase
MSGPLVAVTDHVFADLEPTQQALAHLGADVRLAEAKTPEAILAVGREADGMIVCYADVTAGIIEELEKCQVIARTGIGVDNVDVAAATRAGIVVTNVREYCDDEVSDHAMALLLALVRKVPLMNEKVRGGTWGAGPAKPIHRIRGKVLGLVGFGNIPRQLAVKAHGFGIDVQASDPYVDAETYAAHGVRGVDLDELLSTSDYISVHAPLTDETHNMFDADAFSRMKRGAYLVNTARGPLVDVEALVDALDAGQIAGAGLDVLPEEPPAEDLRLLGRDDVLVTPHIGFYSEDSMTDLQAKAAEQVALVLSGEAPQYPVNAEALGK